MVNDDFTDEEPTIEISDGVPKPIGVENAAMPAPPPASKPLVDYDKTIPMRKATRWTS